MQVLFNIYIIIYIIYIYVCVYTLKFYHRHQLTREERDLLNDLLSQQIEQNLWTLDRRKIPLAVVGQSCRFLQDYKRQKPKMEPHICHFKDLSNLPNIVQCWFRFLAGVIINIKGKNKTCTLKAPGHWLVSVKLILPSTHKVPFGSFWGNALQSTTCGVIFNYLVNSNNQLPFQRMFRPNYDRNTCKMWPPSY